MTENFERRKKVVEFKSVVDLNRLIFTVTIIRCN